MPALVFPQLAFCYEAESLKPEALRWIEKTRVLAHKNQLRHSKSYLRLTHACENHSIHNKFSYSYYSSKQVLSVFDPEELTKIIEAEYYLSPELVEDLAHESFELAMQDCGFSKIQQHRFVISLIAADLLGKVVTIYGFSKGLQLIKGAFNWLKVAHPKVFYTAMGLSVAQAMYLVYDMFIIDSDEDLALHESDLVISENTDLNQMIEVEQSQRNIDQLTFQTLSFLEGQISSLKKQLEDENLSQKKREILTQELQEKEVRKTALEMSMES